MSITVCDLLARAWQIAHDRSLEPEVSIQACLWTAAAELGCADSPVEVGAEQMVVAVIRGLFGVKSCPDHGHIAWFDDPNNKLRHYSSHDASFNLAQALELAAWAQEPENDRFRYVGNLPHPWCGESR